MFLLETPTENNKLGEIGTELLFLSGQELIPNEEKSFEWPLTQLNWKRWQDHLVQNQNSHSSHQALFRNNHHYTKQGLSKKQWAKTSTVSKGS